MLQSQKSNCFLHCELDLNAIQYIKSAPYRKNCCCPFVLEMTCLYDVAYLLLFSWQEMERFQTLTTLALHLCPPWSLLAFLEQGLLKILRRKTRYPKLVRDFAKQDIAEISWQHGSQVGHYARPGGAVNRHNRQAIIGNQYITWWGC